MLLSCCYNSMYTIAGAPRPESGDKGNAEDVAAGLQ